MIQKRCIKISSIPAWATRCKDLPDEQWFVRIILLLTSISYFIHILSYFIAWSMGGALSSLDGQNSSDVSASSLHLHLHCYQFGLTPFHRPCLMLINTGYPTNLQQPITSRSTSRIHLHFRPKRAARCFRRSSSWGKPNDDGHASSYEHG